MKRAVIHNKSELDRAILLNNFRTDCFATVYPSRRIIKDTTIDKLFYDFDTGTHKDIQDNPECYTNIIEIHERLDSVHRIHFSGRGFHCFVYTIPYSEGNDEHKTHVLRSCHRYFSSFGVKPDRQVKDLARMFRIPNTFNISGQRYCIPLDEKMLYSGYDNIRELAKSPQSSFAVFGTELFDIGSVDISEPTYNRVKAEVADNIDVLIPCAQYVMNMIHPDHYQKVAFVAEVKKMFTLGFICDREELIDKIVNFIWSNCKWSDLNDTTITRTNVECVVDTIGFGYSCMSKKDLGICVEGCKLDHIII